MKAMVLDEFGGKLELREVEEPVVNQGEVKLEVEACGICGTDLKILSGKHPNCPQIKFPFIPGHEVCGHIVEIGDGVKGWNIGDRAVVSIYMGCLECESCRRGTEQLCESDDLKIVGFNRNGGYAEKIVVRARNLIRISDSIPAEQAAIVTDAMSASYRSAFEIAKVEAHESALVVGYGGLGVHLAQLLKVAGLHVTVCDINPSKLTIAPEFGFDNVISGSHLDVPDDLKFDVIFDVTGTITDYDPLLKHIKRRGRFVMTGYNVVKPSSFMSSLCHINEVQMLGIRGGSYNNLKKVMEMVEKGQVRPIVGKTRPLAEANELLAELKEGFDTPGRMVLIP